MTLIIPPGFGNAAFIFTGAVGTQPYVTTLGVDLSQYGGDFVGAANALKAAYAVILGPETSSALTLDRVTLTVGDDGPGGSVDSSTAPTAMTRSGTYPPTACSAIARKVTNVLGRRGRGRMFLPGVLSESEIDQDGTVAATRRTSLDAALANFYELLDEGDGGQFPLPPFLFHTQAPADPTPIVQLTVSDLVGWIRGRIR